MKFKPLSIVPLWIPVCLSAMACAVFSQVKFKGGFISTGSSYNQWSSDGWQWEKSDEVSTIRFLSLGGRFTAGEKQTLSIEVPAFLNTLYGRTVSTPIVYQEMESRAPFDYTEIESPTLHNMGIGEIKLGLSRRFNILMTGINFAIPTDFNGKDPYFYRPDNFMPGTGAYLSTPWSGLKAYQFGAWAGLGMGVHSLWASINTVAWAMGKADDKVVHPLDHKVSVGYHLSMTKRYWTFSIPQMGEYSNYRWNGKQNPTRVQFNYESGLKLSRRFRGSKGAQEISAQVLASPFGAAYEDGRSLSSSRKVSMGIYYGFYR